MPRKKIAYREVTLEEMDTEAILARHLQVVLVDGLAHTNILGSNEPEGYLAWSSRLIGFLKYGKNASRQQERALRRLEEHAVFAEDLGAEVIRTKGHDIARTIVEIVKERHVTQIVLGQPARSRWEEILRGSIINRLLRLDVGVDIHLVPQDRDLQEEGS